MESLIITSLYVIFALKLLDFVCVYHGFVMLLFKNIFQNNIGKNIKGTDFFVWEVIAAQKYYICAFISIW